MKVVSMKKKKSSKKPLVAKVYELLKDKIVTLEFAPGSKLEEQNLTQSLKFGRTPIREAIKMLIAEGLIVSYGSNAIYVKDLTLKSAKDLFIMLYQLGDVIFDLADPDADYDSILAALETVYKEMDQAIHKGNIPYFAKLNAEFHKTLANIANNEYLNDLLDRLYCEEIRLAFAISLSLGKLKETPYISYYEKIQAQHNKLIAFLKSRDFGKLKIAYKDHLLYGQKRLSAYFAGTYEEKKRIMTSSKGGSEWTA